MKEDSSFGSSVAISGDYAIVGASLDDNPKGIDVGGAYIYERVDERNWSNPISLTLPLELEEGSQFGLSVAIDGDYAIVGAPYDDNDIGIDAGSVYTYVRSSSGSWNLLAQSTRLLSKTLGSCIAIGEQAWISGSNTCKGDLLEGGHGDMSLIYNTETGLSGSIEFTCNDGTWEADPATASCAPVGDATVSSSNNEVIQPGGDVIIDILHTETAAVEITVTDFEGTKVDGVTVSPTLVSGTSTTPVTVTLPQEIMIGNHNLTVKLKKPAPDDSTISISNPLSISIGCNAIPTTSWGSASQCTGAGLLSSLNGLIVSVDNTALGFDGSAIFACNELGIGNLINLPHVPMRNLMNSEHQLQQME